MKTDSELIWEAHLGKTQKSQYPERIVSLSDEEKEIWNDISSIFPEDEPTYSTSLPEDEWPEPNIGTQEDDLKFLDPDELRYLEMPTDQLLTQFENIIQRISIFDPNTATVQLSSLVRRKNKIKQALKRRFNLK